MGESHPVSWHLTDWEVHSVPLRSLSLSVESEDICLIKPMFVFLSP